MAEGVRRESGQLRDEREPGPFRASESAPTARAGCVGPETRAAGPAGARGRFFRLGRASRGDERRGRFLLAWR